MRDRITAIIAVLLLAALAAASYWYSHAIRYQSTPVPVSREGPDFVADTVTLTQFDAEGRATNRLLAETLSHFPSDDRIEVSRPRLVSLRPDQPQLDVRSQRALVEKGGERVVMTGNVVVSRAAGGADEPPMRMTTERLVALPDQEKYSTDVLADFERGGSRISSIGMDYDHLSRVVRFHSRVRGTVEAATAAKAKS
jgi:lipopolysaccharide export system protein LptC